jgi:hypothetical protein
MAANAFHKNSDLRRLFGTIYLIKRICLLPGAWSTPYVEIKRSAVSDLDIQETSWGNIHVARGYWFG